MLIKGAAELAIYALSDLHLSFSADKPMDVFGDRWNNHTERIYENWQKTVSKDDTVIIAGDVSWATYIEDAYEDFKFIESLNGKKIIIKGNHDYWWTTLKKMNEFLSQSGFNSISIIHNTAIECENAAVCGTRGWSIREEGTNADMRIYDREKLRLILSLEQAARLKKERIVVAMHYPPLEKENNSSEFMEIMKNYNVDCCVYGHLHSYSHKFAVNGIVDGIELKLTAGDYTDFTPVCV